MMTFYFRYALRKLINEFVLLYFCVAFRFYFQLQCTINNKTRILNNNMCTLEHLPLWQSDINIKYWTNNPWHLFSYKRKVGLVYREDHSVVGTDTIQSSFCPTTLHTKNKSVVVKRFSNGTKTPRRRSAQLITRPLVGDW